MKKIVIFFIASLAIMACEDNNKAESSERSEFEGVNLDSVDIVAEDGFPTDYYDSVEQKWYGKHADRLNGVDTSYIEGI